MNNIREVQEYWDQYTTSIQSQFTDKELGSREYFQEIKIHHEKAYTLSNHILDLPGLKDKSVLEVGCGIGLDAAEYAKNGARVTAIDVSPVCIGLAKKIFSYCSLNGSIEIADAEQMPFKENAFDVVVARQILMFTPDTRKAVEEIYRVLKPGGRVLALLHNKYSWYALLGKITGTNLIAEAGDPDINKLYSIGEVKKLFDKFLMINIFFDKFPSETNRRTGLFAKLYNNLFIPFVNLLPRKIIRPFGWYIITSAVK